MKRNTVIFLLLVIPLVLFAQKKQIMIARDLVKSGKHLEKAEKSMRIVLEDSVNRHNKKLGLFCVRHLQNNMRMEMKSCI